MIRAKWWILIAGLVLLVAHLLCVWCEIPSGLGGMKQIIPYLFFSVDRGTSASPGGTSEVRVISNDAGAMHSGCFWTWVVVQHWWGKQVVAKGYLDSSQGPVPLVWLDETSFSITFVKSRYSRDNETVDVRLP